MQKLVQPEIVHYLHLLSTLGKPAQAVSYGKRWGMLFDPWVVCNHDSVQGCWLEGS